MTTIRMKARPVTVSVAVTALNAESCEPVVAIGLGDVGNVDELEFFALSTRATERLLRQLADALRWPIRDQHLVESIGEIQQICGMELSLLSLSDAAEVLGVSAERVRQLVVAGDLPGRRFGNAWVVSRDSVAARRYVGGSGGRPLGQQRAWTEILAGDVELERPGRYQHRADLVRCEMSRADVRALASAGGLLSGAEAARDYGALIGDVDTSDLYVSRSAFDELDRSVAYVHDALGSVRLRVVDDPVFESVPSGAMAPRGAVALDLLDSGDPRHWLAAAEILDKGDA